MTLKHVINSDQYRIRQLSCVENLWRLLQGFLWSLDVGVRDMDRTTCTKTQGRGISVDRINAIRRYSPANFTKTYHGDDSLLPWPDHLWLALTVPREYWPVYQVVLRLVGVED